MDISPRICLTSSSGIFLWRHETEVKLLRWLKRPRVFIPVCWDPPVSRTPPPLLQQWLSVLHPASSHLVPPSHSLELGLLVLLEVPLEVPLLVAWLALALVVEVLEVAFKEEAWVALQVVTSEEA
ncbi:hypothetical protein NXF25_018325 [Crotalus adamanteus]|uniref:Uncharacterized protein n=1 Tax=Crotalus adamanteus TaxID=8729 RepID=A0AAW1ALH9_CROAD